MENIKQNGVIKHTALSTEEGKAKRMEIMEEHFAAIREVIMEKSEDVVGFVFAFAVKEHIVCSVFGSWHEIAECASEVLEKANYMLSKEA